MYKGSCLCSTVKYEVRGELGTAIYCHCSRCRKATATAFATNASVAASDFVIIEGEAELKAFNSSPGVHRIFCSNCGSSIISRRDAMPDVVRLRLGTLDTPLPTQPTAHYFVASKAEWYEILDDLPQFA
ncbi:aldehyde-activating protein [Rhizobium sp. Leaf391]|uniref:GFA family protein n=1 Tax=Rhizobium sp. Leaf391 TaxID=1736360 RepID=UPI0007124D04|nr:GFA family protein [Rhizobium sp. Leaf391]KQT04528.1 aldehyde-activating protein [Rhizobium sp. Leaf391]